MVRFLDRGIDVAFDFFSRELGIRGVNLIHHLKQVLPGFLFVFLSLLHFIKRQQYGQRFAVSFFARWVASIKEA